MVALYNSFQTHVAFYFEVTPGEGPGLAPGPGTDADWVAAEGSTAFRMLAEEADPAAIRGEQAVPSTDMQANTFTVGLPFKGIGGVEGATVVSRVWGTGDTFTDNTQVLGGNPSEVQRLLQHSLGRGALGHHTTIGAVTDQTTFEVPVDTNLQAGYLIRIAAAADPGRAYYAQVLTVSAGPAPFTVTIDREMPFTIAPADLIYGTEMAWPDADALTNPEDPDYSTLMLLIQKSIHVWVAGGGHLALDEIRLERGQQPKFAWSYAAAKGYPEGAGAPSAPDWAGAVAGVSSQVKAVGHDTIVFLQDYGATTWNCETVFAAAFTAGVPVLPQESVTACDSGSPGVGGWRTEPADTTLELVVALTDEQQDRWTQGTLVTASYMQVGPVGDGYCVHIAKGFLMDAPEPVTDGVNRWRIMIQATHDDAATTAPQNAKFVIAR